ncbi:MAG: hypothetical protein RR645_04055 [Clostridium sp.]
MNSIPSNAKGSITVYNEAGYSTQLMYSFHYQGQDYLSWTDPFSLFYSKTITFPDGSSNIKLAVWYLPFSGAWTIFYTKVFDNTPIICYKAYGPVWSPQIAEIPCNSNMLADSEIILASTNNPIPSNPSSQCLHPKYKCCKPKRTCCCKGPYL